MASISSGNGRELLMSSRILLRLLSNCALCRSNPGFGFGMRSKGLGLLVDLLAKNPAP